MLKSQKFLYILIPLLVLIWGTVIYRIISALGGDETNPVFSNPPEITASISRQNDSFSLIADYRDPFLGNMAVEKKPFVEKKIEKPKTVIPTVTTPWPTLTYSGMIRNQQKNKMLALISINGQNYMLKSGEEKDGVKLLSATRDSAVVVFKREKKTIKKI